MSTGGRILPAPPASNERPPTTGRLVRRPTGAYNYDSTGVTRPPGRPGRGGPVTRRETVDGQQKRTRVHDGELANGSGAVGPASPGRFLGAVVWAVPRPDADHR